MAFILPKLDYGYESLEPHIDVRTMEIHHTKHHNGYTSKLNAAVEGSELANESIENILANVSKHSTAIRNNGGGYYNHCLFWDILSPTGGGPATGRVGGMIKDQWGSFEAFQKEFSTAAGTRFGSGWAWLCLDNSGKLSVFSTPNQDNPLMDLSENKGKPLLALDVWEHAYYLHYQNRRPDYVSAFWNLVNWEKVNELLG